MCRYAFIKYKQTYACFNCRKGFKARRFDDYLHQNGLDGIYKKLYNVQTTKMKAQYEASDGTTADQVVAID